MTGTKFVGLVAAFVLAVSGSTSPIQPVQSAQSVGICQVDCAGNSLCEFAQDIFC